jgi:hypothetical protein
MRDGLKVMAVDETNLTKAVRLIDPGKFRDSAAHFVLKWDEKLAEDTIVLDPIAIKIIRRKTSSFRDRRSKGVRAIYYCGGMLQRVGRWLWFWSVWYWRCIYSLE